MEPRCFSWNLFRGTYVARLPSTHYWHCHVAVLTESVSAERTHKREINCAHNGVMKQNVATFCLPGAEAALFEAAGTASAAAGFRAREAPAPPREHWKPGNQAQEGPGPQRPGGAEAAQQWKIKWAVKSLHWILRLCNLKFPRNPSLSLCQDIFCLFFLLILVLFAFWVQWRRSNRWTTYSSRSRGSWWWLPPRWRSSTGSWNCSKMARWTTFTTTRPPWLNSIVSTKSFRCAEVATLP